MTAFKGEMENSTIIVGGFNVPPSVIDSSTRQKISKNIEGLNSTTNQPD